MNTATDAGWAIFSHSDNNSWLKTKSTQNKLHQRWKTRTRSVAPEDTPIESTECISSHDQFVDQPSFELHGKEETAAYEVWLSKQNCAVIKKEDCKGVKARYENPVTRKISMGEKLLPNGDFYAGSFHGNFPEGMGKYLWADGCMYEGEWGRGKKMGKGKISWPSGATYEGDFLCGCLHGAGTYTGVDGTTYRGDWIMNVKHGFGRKRYANGDAYEGAWKEGVQEGFGKYFWANGNNYAGHWKSGLMAGRGMLRWANGDTFDGQWLEGLEHGHGVYTWSDGSSFVGAWNRGQKDGKGTFFPADKNKLEPRAICNQSHSSDESYVQYEEWLGICTPCRSQCASSSDMDSNLTLSSQRTSSILTLKIKSSDGLEIGMEDATESTVDTDNLRQNPDAEESEFDGIKSYVVEREYAQGVLINEIFKECLTEYDLKATSQKRCLQLEDFKRPGETICKGHRSYDLMLSLQLGIRYSVGKLTPLPKCEISPEDFGLYARICMRFPRTGSALTPPHQAGDFTWKDYCPLVFRHLRELFKIDAADYMLSICGSDALRELSSPGKSGSVFYLSHDDRFMIKTMRKTEVSVLLRMLSNYYNHVQTSADTLVTKFFGLHQIKQSGGRKVRFVVMGNMFCTELHIHRRYDLKGSSQGRSTDKVEIDENTTLKDLDLDFVFQLEPSWREALLKQIECDCQLLETENIVDYSLLLGIHFRAPQYPAIFSPMTSNAPNLPLFDGSFKRTDDYAYLEEDCLENRGLILMSHSSESENRGLVLISHSSEPDLSMIGPHVRGRPLKAGGIEGEEVDLLLPGIARLRIQLGVNMPARADKRPQRKECEQPEDEYSSEVYDVVLYLGIIDILQEYDISKRVEHAYKSLQYDPVSISAVEPRLYAKRFLDFIKTVFPAS